MSCFGMNQTQSGGKRTCPQIWGVGCLKSAASQSVISALRPPGSVMRAEHEATVCPPTALAHRAPSSLRTAHLPGLAAAGEKCTECLIPVNLEQIRVHTNAAPTD